MMNDKNNEVLEEKGDGNMEEINEATLITNVNKQEVGAYIDFERVNFDEPSTILNYGKDLITEIRQIMESITALSSDEEDDNFDLEELIKKLPRFGQRLEASQDSNVLSTAVKKGKKIVTAITTKVGLKSPFKSDKFGAQLSECAETIEQIGEAVEEQIAKRKKDYRLNQDFFKKIEPYLLKLDQLIRVGKEDKQQYEETTLRTLELECQNSSDPLAQATLATKKQFVDIFDRQLVELEKQAKTTRIAIGQCQMSQIPNFEYITSAELYVNSTLPALYLQEYVNVNAYRQQQALAKHKGLVEATNKTMLMNAGAINDNIRTATQLSANGGISDQTLEKLNDLAIEGVDLIKSSGEIKRKAIDKSKAQLVKVAESFKNFSIELEKVSRDNLIPEAAAETGGYQLNKRAIRR